jgi:hypothetical protein
VRTCLVHAVADASLYAESDNLAIDFCLDETLPASNYGASLERQVLQWMLNINKFRRGCSISTWCIKAARMLRCGTRSAAVSVVYEQIATLGGVRIETAENRALPIYPLIFI